MEVEIEGQDEDAFADIGMGDMPEVDSKGRCGQAIASKHLENLLADYPDPERMYVCSGRVPWLKQKCSFIIMLPCCFFGAGCTFSCFLVKLRLWPLSS